MILFYVLSHCSQEIQSLLVYWTTNKTKKTFLEAFFLPTKEQQSLLDSISQKSERKKNKNSISGEIRGGGDELHEGTEEEGKKVSFVIFCVAGESEPSLPLLTGGGEGKGPSANIGGGKRRKRREERDDKTCQEGKCRNHQWRNTNIKKFPPPQWKVFAELRLVL